MKPTPSQIALLLSENIEVGRTGLILEEGLKPAIITMHRGTVIEVDHFGGPFDGKYLPFYVAGIRPATSWRYGTKKHTMGKTNQGTDFIQYEKIPPKYVTSRDPVGDAAADAADSAEFDDVFDDVFDDDDKWGYVHKIPARYKVRYFFEKILTINPKNVASLKFL